MRSIVFTSAILLGWAVTHATVIAQPASKTPEAKSVPPADKLRQGLDKSITVDYNGQSLVDVLNHLREKTGLPISIDQGAIMMTGMNVEAPGQALCQVKATNEKASEVLRQLLNAHQLSYITYEGAILVTTQDMALVRQMRQRVSVDLKEVPFNKAVREIAKTHGINLVIDPKMLKQADAPVSLQLDNSGIETTIRLLSELANLKTVCMGNVLFITSAANAKEIRDEEANRTDKRTLPGATYSYPPAMGRGWAMPLPLPRPIMQAPPGIFPPANIVPPVGVPDNKVAPPRPLEGAPTPAVPPPPAGTGTSPPVPRAPAVDPAKR